MPSTKTTYFIYTRSSIELRINVELPDKKASLFEEFVLRKVRSLHAFGVERIIWVFTKSKTVIVANSDNNWKVLDWDTEVEIFEGLTFNIAQHLDEQGIELA